MKRIDYRKKLRELRNSDKDGFYHMRRDMEIYISKEEYAMVAHTRT